MWVSSHSLLKLITFDLRHKFTISQPCLWMPYPDYMDLILHAPVTSNMSWEELHIIRIREKIHNYVEM